MRKANSKSKKYNRDETAFLYLRLSRDDNMDGESYSISNQKTLLTKIAKEEGYRNIVCYIDDGYSGVMMNRPDLQRMLRDLEAGKAAAVFVKDLSRLGRNYIEVGKLTEEFFPEHDIRFIAVSDNVDSEKGENEMTPIKNMFNEWYSRDISKKRRISNRVKGNSGIPLGPPPYGYMKDPADPKHWVIDVEAAEIVRRIFRMTLDGLGVDQIAAALKEDKVLTPMHYWRGKGLPRGGRCDPTEPYRWKHTSIVQIITLQEYCGDVINFKTYSKSYKNKARLHNAPENMAVFLNVHEPIIERSMWESVQEMRGQIRRRKAQERGSNMFSGIVVCADCGANLNYHFNQANPEIKYYNCSNNNNRGDCGKTHYVRVDFLEEVVLGEIRRLTKFATRHEDEFARIVTGFATEILEQRQQVWDKNLRAWQIRSKELDALFERLYEDNVAGKISDDRFMKLSSKYEDEQRELAEKMESLSNTIERESGKTVSAEMFLASVRKYTRAKKLTAAMLNALISKIEVYHREKIDGEWVQRFTIHYNCIGTIEVPDLDNLPETNVCIITRKGVSVKYATS